MYPSRTPRLVSSVLLIVLSLLSSRMLAMARLAIAMRLQFCVQPPEVHETLQDPVVQGMLQGAVVHGTRHDRLPLLWGLAQNPFAQSRHVSLLRQFQVSGTLQFQEA